MQPIAFYARGMNVSEIEQITLLRSYQYKIIESEIQGSGEIEVSAQGCPA